MLDEYLHHLRADQFAGPLDDGSLMELAQTAAAAMSLRTSTYRALDLDIGGPGLAFTPRFALRYGGRRQDAEDARQPEVRRSFNSPFWPFVLASTWVGRRASTFTGSAMRCSTEHAGEPVDLMPVDVREALRYAAALTQARHVTIAVA